jgi:DUF971 family protein
METALPTEIRRLPEARRLRVVWSDGHQAEYDYDYLRGYCPCAGCQGHGTLNVRFQAPSVAVSPLAVEPVGNYAVAFQWSDGHATGIYRFDFLRTICPCDDCATTRKDSGNAEEANQEK